MPTGNRPARTHRYAVIMAGGFGTRFWPQSRRRLPKQLLAIHGRRSLLQETVRRLKGVVPLHHIVVVAGGDLAQQIRSQLPELPRENLLIEPDLRGTAACLALAASWIMRRDPAALMAVFPADHVISDLPRFRRVVRTAFGITARERCLVTFGIRPTSGETGYGYIEVGSSLRRAAPRAYWAARFHEKPHATTARRYVRSKRYLWNSGMFVWRVDVILEAFQKHAPEFAGVMQVAARPTLRRRDARDVLRRAYRRLPAVSIDVAVMERAKRLAVVVGDFGWSDVGSWAAMAAVWGADAAGNASRGKSLIIDSRDTVVCALDRLVAVLGVDDLVVVDSPDALLVCRKSRAQEVRRITSVLAHSRYRHLL